MSTPTVPTTPATPTDVVVALTPDEVDYIRIRVRSSQQVDRLNMEDKIEQAYYKWQNNLATSILNKLGAQHGR